MNLTKKQTKALDFLEDNKTNDLLFGGGAGGGKSAFGCYWQLKRRLKFPGTKGLIGRSILKTLKETTLVSFFEVAKMQGITTPEFYKYHTHSNTIEFYNGSVILLKDLYQYPSDPNFDELGSLEITDAFIDEANQTTIKAKNIVKSRIRFKLDEYKLIPKLLMTCNPAKNWVYTDYYKPSKDNLLPESKRFIQALLTDNPFISKYYQENLLQLDNNSRERLLYGNWEYDDDPTSLCSYDAISDAFTNEPEKGEKAISADLAMQGRDRFVVGVWQGLLCTITVDKLRATGKSIEDDVKEQMKRNRIGHSQTVVDSDGLGSYLESYLTGIKEFHGGSTATDPDEYFNLKSECAYKLASLINERKIKIVCSVEQREIIIEELGCLKADNTASDEKKKRLISKDKMKEIIGHSPDYLDMLIMRMYFIVQPAYKWVMMDLA